jgi:nucleotide-binding universal stress UspA family protein
LTSTHIIEHVTRFKIERILVPVDGSSNSQRAAEVAISLAKDYKAEICFLNVVPTPKFSFGASAVLGTPAVALDKYYEHAESQGQDLIEKMIELAKNTGVEASGEIAKSNESIVQSIIDQAKERKADLIVIGTRGLTSFKKLLIGSVSSGVVTYAESPVLVVR